MCECARCEGTGQDPAAFEFLLCAECHGAGCTEIMFEAPAAEQSAPESEGTPVPEAACKPS